MNHCKIIFLVLIRSILTFAKYDSNDTYIFLNYVGINNDTTPTTPTTGTNPTTSTTGYTTGTAASTYNSDIDIDSPSAINEINVMNDVLLYNNSDYSIFQTESSNSSSKSNNVTIDLPNVDDDIIGPKLCPSNSSMMGYSNLASLNHDMYTEALQLTKTGEDEKEEYVYILCPNTIMNIPINKNEEKDDESSNEEALIPALSNTVIKCGYEGIIDNRCIVSGGIYQILFHPELKVQNVTFMGIQFMNNVGVSIAGWGHPLSSAFFYDCRWLHNKGYNLVELNYYSDGSSPSNNPERSRRLLADPKDTLFKSITTRRRLQKYEILATMLSSSSVSDITTSTTEQKNHRITKEEHQDSKIVLTPSMSMGFYNCLFQENKFEMSLMMNTGGILEMSNSILENNFAKSFIIGIVFDGYLMIKENTIIRNNTATFYTIFIDSTSMYILADDDNNNNTNEVNGVHNNTGNTCNNGIFIEEEEESLCLYGKECLGSCCQISMNDLTNCVPTAESNASIQGSDDNGSTDTTLLPQVASSSENLKEEVVSSSTTMEQGSSPSTVPANPSSPSGACGQGCIATAVVIPIIGVFIAIGVVVFIRRRGINPRQRNTNLHDFNSMEFL